MKSNLASNHLNPEINKATKYFRSEGTIFNELYYLTIFNSTIYLSPTTRVSGAWPQTPRRTMQIRNMLAPLLHIHKEIFNDRVTVNGRLFISSSNPATLDSYTFDVRNSGEQCTKFKFQILNLPILLRARSLAMRRDQQPRASLD